MKVLMLCFSVGISYLSLSNPVLADTFALTQEGIDGIYTGTMQIQDRGVTREVPLALSMFLTDEVESTPGGNINVIDSAFVVDEEGGPYNFTRVSYDFESNRLDLKYSRGRPGADPNSSLPASLRFIARFESNDVLTGNVHSGLVGALGTFRLERSSSLTTLPLRSKYFGAWEGESIFLRNQKKRSTSITLQNATTISVNPPNLELDFTPGKICGYSVDGVWVIAYKNVNIDYFRQRVYASDQKGEVSLEMELNFTDNSLSGFTNSAAWGLTSTFERLTKIIQ